MKKDLASKGFLLLIDLLAFYTSLTLASLTTKLIFRFSRPQFPFSHLFKLWWMPLTFVFFFIYEKLYTKRLPFWDETRKMLKAITGATVVTLAIASMGNFVEVSWLTLALLWFYGIFTFPIFRSIGKTALFKAGIWKERLAIIGSGETAKSIAEFLKDNGFIGYEVTGFVDKNGSSVDVEGEKVKVIGSLNDIETILRDNDIKAVAITTSFSKNELIKVIGRVQDHVKAVLIASNMDGIPVLNNELFPIFMEQLLLVKIDNNLRTPKKALKRAFDIVFSIILLPFLLPIMAIIGIAIKLDSKGPIFFSHERIGHNGKSFKVLKFRSMYVDADRRLKEILESDPQARKEWERNFKLKNDPRVTKVGRFLRKTSLDELPQIFNVLLGQMSFVGPRPVVKKEIEKYYRDKAEFYFRVKPGITGLWQVSGRSDTDYDFRVKLDVWYVLNWSLWLDIILIFKTIKCVIKGEGAY